MGREARKCEKMKEEQGIGRGRDGKESESEDT